jgi:hypothetical protein
MVTHTILLLWREFMKPKLIPKYANSKISSEPRDYSKYTPEQLLELEETARFALSICQSIKEDIEKLKELRNG